MKRPSLTLCDCGATSVVDGNAHQGDCRYAQEYGQYEAAVENAAEMRREMDDV